jgi:hypothetical protein
MRVDGVGLTSRFPIQMNEEPTLYERVWREIPPGSPAANHPMLRNKAMETYAGPNPADHVWAARDEGSISELIDQLEAWDTQQAVMATQTEGRVVLALEALETRMAQLQRTPHLESSLSGEPMQHPQVFSQELAKLGAELADQLTKMHFEIERQLERQRVDMVKRVEELEASIRNRDLTFIESLVTVAELSWRKPDHRLFDTSLESSAPPA